MSEPMELVGVKLPRDLVRRLDKEIALWSPFINKRGPMARSLIEIAFVLMDAGIVERRPIAEQGLLRKLRATSLSELTELPKREGAADLAADLAAIGRRKP